MPGYKLGLKRPLQIVFNASADEDELITRIAFNDRITKRDYIIRKVLGRFNISKELKKIRHDQRHITLSFRRTKYDGNGYR